MLEVVMQGKLPPPSMLQPTEIDRDLENSVM